MEKGSPARFGATVEKGGTNFAIFSEAAEHIELCLFDNAGTETGRVELPAQTDNTWHGFLPGCAEGQRYGYRVHGPYAADEGLRCNPNKLLIDPYARELSGEFRWAPAVFDYESQTLPLAVSDADSAPHVPKCVVTAELAELNSGPAIPWREMVIYEANVRGYTMRHPGVGERERGRFAGMRNGDILAYLKSLGITSIELMPVHAFIDEQFLDKRGLRNFWGYNSINFFTPAGRYADSDPRGEFRAMVDAIHDAGMEVILDVVYNHTGESGRLGPTLSFRGLDNLAYYQVEPDDFGTYINDTGCGNTINGDHPVVRRMIVDSLVYWSQTMGVDGFRFELAPVLGRHGHGFSPDHPLLRAISCEPALAAVKLIAVPWDPGPGGYQLGRFPAGWAEWNDQYRDAIRQFWRGDHNSAGEFARRIHGSADLFDTEGRDPSASINFVSAHDGFTLADVVSYEHRHNEVNGEDNRDGHAHNYSHNYGVEGPTGNEEIAALRRRQRLNMLASVLLSHGTPMLLAGDEFGNSQDGNNNAYAQDNEIGWLDWSGVESDPAFVDEIRKLTRLRRENPPFRPVHYRHGHTTSPQGWQDIEWLYPDGTKLAGEQWHEATALTMLLSDTDGNAVAVLCNASDDRVAYEMPESRTPITWRTAFYSGGQLEDSNGPWALTGRTIACLVAD